MTKRKSPKRQSTSLIIRSVDLPAEKRALIQVATPTEFIRERPGKGGKTFRYIEGGYVIARLNQIFSPIGWDFSILNQQIEPQEVIVRGRLEVKDFKTGFSIGKTRTGTKERVAGITLGDTIKAAETDSLKKCASHFGIGLDVYWQQLDEDKLNGTTKAPKIIMGKSVEKYVQPSSPNATISREKLTKMSLDKIKAETDETILSQYFQKIQNSGLYNQSQKNILIKAIADQRKKIVKNYEQGNLL